MSNSSYRVRDTDPRFLAEIMAVDEAAQRVWRPEELGAIFQHQLSAPVELDLGNLEPGLGPKLRMLASSQGLLLNSFRDLLQHPNPPIELLRLTKEFAKACRDHPESPLPPEIATVLYYASITVALTRCGRRISGLDDAALRGGLEWAVSQPWVDESTRALLQQGLDSLSL